MNSRFTLLATMIIALSACAPVPHTPAGVAAEHNARIALDWAGRYQGVLPCADCEGISVIVTLADNGTYVTRQQYLGKRGSISEEKGRFSWNPAGNTVTLGHSDPTHYFVAENRLIRLAPDGSRITGALADLYVLTKTPGQ